MNTALGSCTRLVLAHGSTWLNRCSAFSSAERWRDTMSMMWRSSKTGFATPSRDGIGIGPPFSGEASDTHAVTGPMRAVIGWAAQELPPSMCFHGVFAPCAITDGSAIPSQMATDPLAKGVQKIWYQWPSGCLLFSYACCCILLLSACESHAVSTFPVLQTVSDVLALPSKILVWKLPLDD